MLNLPTIPYPKLYKIERIKENGGIVVSKKVNIPISMGSYHKTILCDIISMNVGHILLGRLCKSYHRVIHECQSTKIIFII